MTNFPQFWRTLDDHGSGKGPWRKILDLLNIDTYEKVAFSTTVYPLCVSELHQCSELVESWKNMKLNFQIYLPSRDHPDKLFFNYLHKFFGIIWWFFKVWYKSTFSTMRNHQIFPKKTLPCSTTISQWNTSQT